MMHRTKRRRLLLGVLLLALALLLPTLALAGPRSGGSFGGRGGFRSTAPRSAPSAGRSYGYGSGYGSGPSVFFFPGFGYGGCGGGGLVGGLILVVVLGVAAVSIARVVRRLRGNGQGWSGENESLDQAFVVRAQIALGRSARDIQDRLAQFAAEGDTSSQAGLQALLQQTTLELLRNRDSFRYVHVGSEGPLSMNSAESRMNGMALQERSRFQVERVRSADGTVRRATQAAEEGKEALEYVLVTLIAATNVPLLNGKKKRESAPLEDTTAVLTLLGGLAPEALLGLEVIWTPADPNDSLTETDLLTTYPELRGV